MNPTAHVNALVVDDDDSLRDMVLALMSEIGFRSVQFAALNHVFGHAGDRLEAPDLIVLDLSRRPGVPVHRRLAALFPRAAIVTVDDGAYERALGAALADGPRRRRQIQFPRRSQRAHAHALVRTAWQRRSRCEM
jgi:hypothetical protein